MRSRWGEARAACYMTSLSTAQIAMFDLNLHSFTSPLTPLQRSISMLTTFTLFSKAHKAHCLDLQASQYVPAL
jgi:hypothetical protein